MTAIGQSAARPERPSHAKRDLSLLGAALLIGLAAVTVSVDVAKILELPGGLALVFYEMFLESGP
ncbi:MAG: hypothetical protein ACRDGD_02670, partial [Candidatus Limnocylindria bacterium]